MLYLGGVPLFFLIMAWRFACLFAKGYAIKYGESNGREEEFDAKEGGKKTIDAKKAD